MNLNISLAPYLKLTEALYEVVFPQMVGPPSVWYWQPLHLVCGGQESLKWPRDCCIKPVSRKPNKTIVRRAIYIAPVYSYREGWEENARQETTAPGEVRERYSEVNHAWRKLKERRKETSKRELSTEKESRCNSKKDKGTDKQINRRTGRRDRKIENGRQWKRKETSR